MNSSFYFQTSIVKQSDLKLGSRWNLEYCLVSIIEMHFCSHFKYCCLRKTAISNVAVYWRQQFQTLLYVEDSNFKQIILLSTEGSHFKYCCLLKTIISNIAVYWRQQFQTLLYGEDSNFKQIILLSTEGSYFKYCCLLKTAISNIAVC